MKIVYLVAGSSGMYCGTCLHGNTLAVAVGQAGHDVLMAPAYTPVLTDEDQPAQGRMVFGGINVYLQQRFGLFRHTPWLVDRLLDRPRLLGWLGKLSASRRPAQLGELTVSMLRGHQGRQRKEIDKLVVWLEQEIRPDLVHLSTVMLAGAARQIQRTLGVPVVGTLSGEDLFLSGLVPPHDAEARTLLGERCAELSAMIALNRYYADFAAEQFSLPRGRIHVIPPGLNLAGHRPLGQLAAPAGPPHGGSHPITIGYLARICPEKGLHLLAEAFARLASDQRLPPARLVAGGFLDRADRPYLEAVRSRLADAGLSDRFQYVGAPDRAAKIALVQSFDLMCVPTVYAESKGIYVLEAWANGVPVVLPAHGAFPEMVADTGGGLLATPHDPDSLADALRRLILNPSLAADCGRKGQQAVYDRYHAHRMARQTIELYERVVLGEKQAAGSGQQAADSVGGT